MSPVTGYQTVSDKRELLFFGLRADAKAPFVICYLNFKINDN